MNKKKCMGLCVVIGCIVFASKSAHARTVLDVIYYHYRSTILEHASAKYDLIPELSHEAFNIPRAPLQTDAIASSYHKYYQSLAKFYETKDASFESRSKARFYRDMSRAAQEIAQEKLYALPKPIRLYHRRYY